MSSFITSVIGHGITSFQMLSLPLECVEILASIFLPSYTSSFPPPSSKCLLVLLPWTSGIRSQSPPPIDVNYQTKQ